MGGEGGGGVGWGGGGGSGCGVCGGGVICRLDCHELFTISLEFQMKV